MRSISNDCLQAPHMRGPETTIDELSGQKQSTDRPNTSTGDQHGRPSGALLDKGGQANPRPAGGMAEASSRSTETQRKRRRSAVTPVNIGALVNTSGIRCLASHADHCPRSPIGL